MIIDRIYHWARQQPDKTAVIIDDGKLSYATFARAIEVTRRFFASQGLPAGQTAVVLLNNPLDGWLFVIALRAIGLNTIAVQTLATAEDLNLKNVACIVSTQPQTPGEAFRSRQFSRTRVITVSNAIYAGIRAGDVPSYQTAYRPFGGHIIYSSGTTGTSKKMMMEGAIETKRNEDRARLLSFDANTVYHNLDFGLWVSLGVKNPASVWHMGGCVILDIRPNKFEHFFRHGVTSAYLVPPQLKDFLAAPRPAAPPQTPCELVVTAGVLTLDVAQAMTRQLSPNIFLSYASSEMGIPPLRSQFKTADDLYWFTPLGDRVVQVVDEDHRECPPGQEGLLRIGLNDLDCWTYVDDDEASAKVFHDGFFYPGDMAVKRADGRFRILGRATDVMNVQGAKIVVTPLEQAIQRELKVDEVCLFAGLNDDGVEEIVVAIQSGRELSQGELNMMRRHLPELTRVRFEVMKSFPRSEAGMKKTQRSVLRRMVFSKRQPT